LEPKDQKMLTEFHKWLKLKGLTIPAPFKEDNNDLRLLILNDYDF